MPLRTARCLGRGHWSSNGFLGDGRQSTSITRGGHGRKRAYHRSMLVLGIETSCDETGLALYDTERGLLAHALHSQVAMHGVYGGVVPELASRDHIRRLVPLTRELLARAGLALADIDAVAYTEGPGL